MLLLWLLLLWCCIFDDFVSPSERERAEILLSQRTETLCRIYIAKGSELHRSFMLRRSLMICDASATLVDFILHLSRRCCHSISESFKPYGNLSLCKAVSVGFHILNRPQAISLLVYNRTVDDNHSGRDFSTEVDVSLFGLKVENSSHCFSAIFFRLNGFGLPAERRKNCLVFVFIEASLFKARVTSN